MSGKHRSVQLLTEKWITSQQAFCPLTASGRPPAPGPLPLASGSFPPCPQIFQKELFSKNAQVYSCTLEPSGIGHCDLIEVAQHIETSPAGPVPLQGSGTPRVTRGACSDVPRADWQEGLAPWGFHVNTPDLNPWGAAPSGGQPAGPWGRGALAAAPVGEGGGAGGGGGPSGPRRLLSATCGLCDQQTRI